MTEAVKLHRPIRSYVRREGRMTRAQRRALRELWSKYGVDRDRDVFDLDALFGRRAPTVLEIGFGDGKSLAKMAAAHPQDNYLGIEVYRPGVGGLLLRLQASGIENVRAVCGDAAEVLTDNIPDDSLDGVLILFPDPWPKKRHHKRRLIQKDFIHLIGRKLKPDGRLRIATDWADYAEHIVSVMAASREFKNVTGKNRYAPRLEDRPLTKYEERGQRLGHEVRYFMFERRPRRE